VKSDSEDHKITTLFMVLFLDTWMPKLTTVNVRNLLSYNRTSASCESFKEQEKKEQYIIAF
jgi:hypothetical protein